MGDGDDGVVVVVVGGGEGRKRGGEREKAGILVVRRWGLRPVFAQARDAESEFTTLLQEDIQALFCVPIETQ